MKCPGRDCLGTMPAGDVACPACLERVHPKIRARLDFLRHASPDSPAHVALVASLVRLLREGIP